jgi:penicillin-insensitive murein DD-endopeptidase
MRWLALGIALLAGCAELGLSDGTSISVGKPSNGYLLAGVRLPDRGEGFVTREVWRARNNRFGTDELIDLVTAVARRMHAQVPGVKLVVADLSGRGGGERAAFHRSHQTGRDADLLYYMRDAAGQPFEPDAMHVFDAAARAVDGTGITIDVPRTWALVKELITAPEAPVQWIFMYEPIAQRLLAHAQQLGEPEALLARARATLRQPGDSARHDDHLHVRVYCSIADQRYGCVDIGPMELLAERAAEPSPMAVLVAALSRSPIAAEPARAPVPGGGPAALGSPAVAAPSVADVGGLGVAGVGGRSSAVGGTSSAVGGTSSAVGGTSSAVGGTSSAVGGTSSAVGGTSSAIAASISGVGGSSVAAGGSSSAVGGTSPAVVAGVFGVGGSSVAAGGSSVAAGGSSSAIAASFSAAAGAPAAAVVVQQRLGRLLRVRAGWASLRGWR